MNEMDLSLKRSTTEYSKIGEKLRYARESKGLSQQEVSRALCLSVAIIDALEREAHEELSAPVFIKGYLKNYAEFLRLPVSSEDIQVQKTIEYTKRYHQKKAHSTAVSLLLSTAYILLKILNYIIFPVFLLLIFLWWHEKHHAAEKILPVSNNISISENPFPRLHIQPMPPDITPWLDAEKGDAQ